MDKINQLQQNWNTKISGSERTMKELYDLMKKITINEKGYIDAMCNRQIKYMLEETMIGQITTWISKNPSWLAGTDPKNYCIHAEETNTNKTREKKVAISNGGNQRKERNMVIFDAVSSCLTYILSERSKENGE